MGGAGADPLGHISIHALREEGDMAETREMIVTTNFYPRPPRGGRLQRVINLIQLVQFLSTPSARRATSLVCRAAHAFLISIHALREEGDFHACGLDS